LVKSLAAHAGVSTHTIELSNIVVGDLPFKGYGDFYLSIECAQNPPIVTSLAEHKHPKVVHFPEVITLRVRESIVEKPVRIKVLELNIVGSVELCEVHLTTMNAVSWAADPHKGKRFVMLAKDREYELATPPWIALDFNFPLHDPRHLDSLHAAGGTVRTALWDAPDSRKGQSTYMDSDLATFKHRYSLVDSGGNIVQEPPEEDIRYIFLMRRCVQKMVQILTFLSVMSTIVLGAVRLYLGSCYQGYYTFTQAIGGALGAPLVPPIPIAKLRAVHKYCAQEFTGTGAHEGIPCRPLLEKVLETCLHMPPHSKRPMAFSRLLEDTFGEDPPIQPLGCPAETCRHYVTMSAWDNTLLLGCLGMAIFSVFCLRPCAHMAVDKCKKSLTNQRNHIRQMFEDTHRAQRGLATDALTTSTRSAARSGY